MDRRGNRNDIGGGDTFDKSVSSIRWVKANYGRVFVNSVVPISIDIEEWRLFLRELNDIGVDQIALISLSPRGRGAICIEDFDKAHKNMLLIEDLARNEGMPDFVYKWDYLTVSHGYLLVENDGRIVLPGVFEDEDILIGGIGNINSNSIANQIKKYKKLLNYNMTS